MKRYLPLLAALTLPSCKETEVTIVTYNVHGLPSDLADTDPEKIKQIGPLLNRYDIVLIQEDFVYHKELAAEAEHPYQEPITEEELIKSMQEESPLEIKNGLSTFSHLPIDKYAHRGWNACNGLATDSRDCLAPKGFSVGECEVAPGVKIDIYNCHMDAGSSPGDIAARQKQIQQLAEFMDRRSRYHGVILACDTNLESSDQYDLENLLRITGLQDSCQTLGCSEPGLIDRILYRSSALVQIQPLRWYTPEEFVDEREEPLSDHKPVAVNFKISLMPPSTNR